MGVVTVPFSSDGYGQVVDRLHINHYPSKAEEIETHMNLYENQRTILEAQISEWGKDYKTGDLYLIDKKGGLLNVDSEISIDFFRNSTFSSLRSFLALKQSTGSWIATSSTAPRDDDSTGFGRSPR